MSSNIIDIEIDINRNLSVYFSFSYFNNQLSIWLGDDEIIVKDDRKYINQILSGKNFKEVCLSIIEDEKIK